jgi:hypothetical protein
MLYDLNGERTDFALHEVELNHAMKRLAPAQVTQIDKYLDEQIQGREFVRSSDLGPKWRNTPLEALWKSDPNVYGLVFGAWLWRVFLHRPEAWNYKKIDNLKEISGMDYFQSGKPSAKK